MSVPICQALSKALSNLLRSFLVLTEFSLLRIFDAPHDLNGRACSGIQIHISISLFSSSSNDYLCSDFGVFFCILH